MNKIQCFLRTSVLDYSFVRLTDFGLKNHEKNDQKFQL